MFGFFSPQERLGQSLSFQAQFGPKSKAFSTVNGQIYLQRRNFKQTIKACPQGSFLGKLLQVSWQEKGFSRKGFVVVTGLKKCILGDTSVTLSNIVYYLSIERSCVLLVSDYFRPPSMSDLSSKGAREHNTLLFNLSHRCLLLLLFFYKQCLLLFD